MADADIATLGLAVDSTQVLQAAQRLDQLADAARKVQTPAADLEAKNLDLAKSWLLQAEMAGKSRAEVIRLQSQYQKMSGDAKKAAEAAALIFEQRDKQNALQARITALGRSLGTLAAGFLSLRSAVGWVQSFAEAEEISQKLANMLEITGHRAGKTSEELENLAVKLQGVTRFGDEEIKQLMTTMTRFGSVTGDNFDRATRLALDLAEVMGGDARSAAETLGRALETSFGAQMLKRQGLLNDEQARTIANLKEMGKDAQAQEALFAALESTVGGLAERMGERGLASAFKSLSNQLGDAGENLGMAIAKFTGLENKIRDLTELVKDANEKGVGSVIGTFVQGILDSLGIRSMEENFDYSASFRRGEEAQARFEREAGLIGLRDRTRADASRDASAKAELERQKELNAELVKRGAILDELVVKAGKQNASIKNEAELRAMVREQWAAGNVALLAAYNSEEEAVRSLLKVSDWHKKNSTEATQKAKELETAYRKLREELDDSDKAALKYAESARVATDYWRAGKITQEELEKVLIKLHDRYDSVALAARKAAEEGAEAAKAAGDAAESALLDLQKLRERDQQLRRGEGSVELQQTAQQIAALQNELREYDSESSAAAQAIAESIRRQVSALQGKLEVIRSISQAEAIAASAQKAEQANEDLRAQIVVLREKAETLNLTTVETRAYELARIDANIADAQAQILDYERANSPEAAKLAAQLRERIVLLEQLRDRTVALQGAEVTREAADKLKETSNSITQSLTDALLRGFENGKDFAANFVDTLKNMFKTLVLRPVIQMIVAPVGSAISGALAGLFPSTAGASSGGASSILGSGLSSLLGGGTSALGYSGLGLGGSGIFSSLMGLTTSGGFGAGLLGGFGAPMATIAELFSGGTAAFGGMAGALGAGLGAALPVVGIGLALASAFGLFDRGGPKTGGSASSLADVLGGTTGLGTLERLFTPNQRDSDVQKVTDSIATSFLNVARSLGIAGGTAQFGLGFDTDPEGDAGNRVSALATLNGQTVYQVTDRDLGREGDVTAAMQEEAQRALLAALQASEMPEYLSRMFAELDAASATEEEINDLIATASALKIAVDAISGLGDQFAAMDPSVVREFVESFGGLESFMQRFAFINENFYTDAQKLDRATTQLNDAFKELGIAVPDTHAAFLDLLNGLNLTKEADRELYEALSALAPLFIEVRGTAQEAADALEDAAGALDEVAQAASNIIDLGSLSGTVYGEASSAIARIVDLAAQIGGSIGDQLTRRMNLANGEIQRYIALWQQAQPGSAESQALLEIIGLLQQFNAQTANELALYTSIVAQYGAAHADAIFELQQFYWQQQQLFQGNTQALSDLAIWYNAQLQEILNGTEDGVGGTVEQLKRLRESLRDYLDSLVLNSQLTTLAPQQQLEEAQSQYLELLARAQGGDVEALAEIQRAADVYLRIAREFYASGGQYTAIFQSVIDALRLLATEPETGGTEPKPEASLAAIAAAVPNDSPIMSQRDAREIMDMVAALIEEVRAGSALVADRTDSASDRNARIVTSGRNVR